jgi:ectoine hydroxylase-related dioxygenase (phytanoyl-CoA dioxygenase family)
MNTIDRYNILNNEYRCKSHLLFDWVNKLSRNPKIINIIKEIIGEDIICIDTMFWGKSPKTDQFVSFHQDGYYWNIKEPINGATVWIPFQDTNEQNGTMIYLKESNKKFLKHIDIKNDLNMLRRGQTIDISTLSFEKILCPTALGEAIFHDPYCVHGSFPNNSSSIRLACNIQYISAKSQILIEDFVEYGTLISGTNQSNISIVDNLTGNFDEDYTVWYKAWYNQRQNYLKHKGR